MVSIKIVVAGLAAIVAALPLSTNGDGFAFGAPKTSLQLAEDGTLEHGRMFVEKAAVEVRDYLAQPLEATGTGQAIEPRFISIVAHGGALSPLMIFGIVCACIVGVASIVGFILYCYSDRIFHRNVKTMDDVHEAADRVDVEALKPNGFVKDEDKTNALAERAAAILASPEAQKRLGERDEVLPPARCHVKPQN